MQNGNKALLVEGPVGTTLVKLTIPMVLGVVGMVVFNLVDTFFIGQLGTDELAAISFTFPVVFIVGSLAMGLGMGASALISRAIGQGDHSKVQRLTTDSLTLSMLMVGLFLVIGLMTIDPVFTLLGAAPSVMPFIRDYMVIWYPSTFFLIIPMVGNNAIRATGDTKTPSMIMIVAVVVNIILDPLLIFGFGPIPRLEITGAAIATAVSRAFIFFVSMWILYYRDKMITLVLPDFKAVLDSWKRILYIGLPAAGSNMVMPLGTGVITGLIAAHGSEAVAGFGVASRLEMFALIIIMALSSVLGPFVGQNWGAGKYHRVNLGVKYSLQFSMGWGVIALGIFAASAPFVAPLFNASPVVISVTVTYLWIVPLSFGFQGIVLLAKTVLNVLNRPIDASILTIGQMFILYIPLAYGGSYLFGVSGIFVASVVAHFVAGIVGYVWLKRNLAMDEALLVNKAGNLTAAKPVN